MPPIARQRGREGSPRSVSDTFSSMSYHRTRPTPLFQQKSAGMAEEESGYYAESQAEYGQTVPRHTPRGEDYMYQSGQSALVVPPFFETPKRYSPMPQSQGSFSEFQPLPRSKNARRKPRYEFISQPDDDEFEMEIEGSYESSQRRPRSDKPSFETRPSAKSGFPSVNIPRWEESFEADYPPAPLASSSPSPASVSDEMEGMDDFLPKGRSITYFDSDRPTGVPMDRIPSEAPFDFSEYTLPETPEPIERSPSSDPWTPWQGEGSGPEQRPRWDERGNRDRIPQRYRKLALNERFSRASKIAYEKLREGAFRPRNNDQLANFVYHLGTESEVADRGFHALDMLLNHEVLSSLPDVYCFLHVAYAMSQTETKTPCRSTSAEFQTGLDALRNCLDNTRPEDMRTFKSDADIFDEIVAIMWDEIDMAMGWLGKQEGLDILESLRKAARKLEKNRRLLKRLQVNPRAAMDIDDYGGRQKSKWKDVVTGSIFGIVVGFMRAAGEEWKPLLSRFSTAAYSFLLDPLHQTSGDLLHFFATFFNNLYNVTEPALSQTCDPGVFDNALSMLRKGTISTLRGFENYLLHLGKISSYSREQFLNFTEAVLRQSCTCANLVSEGGNLKGVLEPIYAKEYGLEYLTERFNRAAEEHTYPPPSRPTRMEPAQDYIYNTSSSSPEHVASSSPESIKSATGVEIICRLPNCGRMFSTRPNLYRHQRVAHPELVSGDRNGTEYICGYNGCTKVLRRKDNVHKHRRVVHGVVEKLRVNRA